MDGHDIIVIGASAGGVETLSRLVSQFPPGLRAAVFVVVHFPAHSTSVLPSILRRNGPLPVEHPVDGEAVQTGRIYVAPPDMHLTLNNQVIQLTRGPQVHGFRPAIDPLFASTARGFGPRAVGVILSGTLSDGAAGLLAIKTAGGVAIVQDPEEAAFSGMPLKALEVVDADFILPVSEIAQTLVNLSGEPVGLMKGSERLSGESETDIIRKDMHNFEQGKRPASTTVLTCPECGGVLFELFDGLISKFRCHVGHEYSSDSLLSEQAHALESALWSAIRALEERASLLERMSILSGNNNNRRTAERFKERSHEAERNADLLRQVLMKGIGAGQEVNDAPEYGD